MKRYLLVTLLLMTAIWGCAAEQDIVILDDRLSSVESRLGDLAKRSIDLQNQLDGMDAHLVDYRSRIGKEDQAIRDQAAGIRVTISQLREEIQILTGLSEENRYLLKQKIKSLENTEKKRDLELNRMEDLNASITNRILRLEEYLNLEPLDKKEAGEGTKEPAETEQSEKERYETAKQAFDNGDLEASRDGFEKFLKRYPKSGQADNAQFWIGEIYYREKWYEKSILEYQKVVEKYPKGNKVPAALLKQGFAFLNLGDKANSRLILKELVRKYPGSKEAQIAGKKLKKF
jgi:tol-pal system protein YbgF